MNKQTLAHKRNWLRGYDDGAKRQPPDPLGNSLYQTGYLAGLGEPPDATPAPLLRGPMAARDTPIANARSA